MNSISQQAAKHFRDVYLGGNWTTTNVRSVLADVTWQEATTPIGTFNTIAILTNHIGYYLPILIDVLEGKPLNGKDELSFVHPELLSEDDWQQMQHAIWTDVEKASELIERMPETQFNAAFTDEKFGTYFRNIHGIIEHTHYHLGQIVILKGLLQNNVNR